MEGNFIFYGSPIGGMSGGPLILKTGKNIYEMVGLLHSAYTNYTIFNNGINLKKENENIRNINIM